MASADGTVDEDEGRSIVVRTMVLRSAMVGTTFGSVGGRTTLASDLTFIASVG